MGVGSTPSEHASVSAASVEISRIEGHNVVIVTLVPSFEKAMFVRLTDRASAAATWWPTHNPPFLKPEAPVSCVRLLGANLQRSSTRYSMRRRQKCPAGFGNKLPA